MPKRRIRPTTRKTEDGKLIVNWDQVAEMARIHCTIREIASVLGCSEDSLDTHCKADRGEKFTVFYNKNKDEGKERLRKAQLRVALEGNPTMLVWCGKNILDQSDKQVITSTVDTTVHEGIDLSQLTEEELQAYLVLSQKVRVSPTKQQPPIKEDQHD